MRLGIPQLCRRLRTSAGCANACTPAAPARELPLVDLSAADADAAAALHRACATNGAFALANHGVPLALTRELFTDAKAFFARPTHEKLAISFRKSECRGYQPLGENVTQNSPDQHEALDFYSESELARGYTHYGRNRWPERPASFKHNVERYWGYMHALGQRLVGLVERGLGLRASELGQYFSDPYFCTRVIHYPGHTRGKHGAELGCGEHQDYGFLTLLQADDLLYERPGSLQVRGADGVWSTVQAAPGALVCNIGDMLSRWTGGLYRATPHRVMLPSESRVSVAYFHEPDYTAVVRPLFGDSRERAGGVMFGDHLYSKTSSNFRTAR